MYLGNSHSIVEEYTDFFKEEIKNQVNKEEFLVPTLATLVEAHPDVYERLLAQYKYQGTADTEDGIEDDTKVYQAFLSEGVCWGYNTDNGSLDLYTADESILKQIENGLRGMDKDNILARNSRGHLAVKRLDVEYTNMQGSYTLRAVTPSRGKVVVKDTYVFLPYKVVSIFFALLDHLLKGGAVLKVRVQEGSAVKERFITFRPDVHKHYGSYAEGGLDFLPLVAKGYAPVVGAPQTTLGKTAIRVQSIVSLNTVPNSEVTSLPIKKADNSVEGLIRSEVMSSFISHIKASDDDKLKYNLYELFKQAGDNSISLTSSRLAYIKSYRKLAPEQAEYVWSNIDPTFREYANVTKRLIRGFQRCVVPTEMAEFRHKMSTGLYRITTLGTAGKFTTLYATNNLDILFEAYGPDYVARRESTQDKLRYLGSIYSQQGYTLLPNDRFIYYIRTLGLGGVYNKLAESLGGFVGVQGEMVKIIQGLGAEDLSAGFILNDSVDEEEGALKVRTLFNLRGAPYPIVRKIKLDSVYQMSRLDI